MHWLIAAFAFLVASGASAIADVDSCTESMYLDRTASNADRDLDWQFSFASDPERCLMIRIGQRVTWHGNFADHPLQSDQGDRPNPIDNPQAGVVLFDRPGVFGFRCNFHLEMRGAIWVLPMPVEVSASAWPSRIALPVLLLAAGMVGSRRARFVR